MKQTAHTKDKLPNLRSKSTRLRRQIQIPLLISKEPKSDNCTDAATDTEGKEEDEQKDDLGIDLAFDGSAFDGC